MYYTAILLHMYTQIFRYKILKSVLEFGIVKMDLIKVTQFSLMVLSIPFKIFMK